MVSNKNISKILKIIEKNIKVYDPPVVEKVSKHYKTPFHILVSTMLSARTKENITEKVCENLFSKISSPDDLIKIDLKKLENIIHKIGFYKTKSKNLKKMAKILIEKYNGKVPDDIDSLLELPGVGRKTANLVLIEAFNKYGICVDTHVHKILNRLGYVKTEKPDETEKVLREKLPKKLWKKINRILVLFGQNICKSIKPKCEICPIKKYCKYNLLS